MSEFGGVVREVTEQARANVQASTLAHLGHAALRLGPRREEAAVKDVVTTIEANILRRPPVKLAQVHTTKFDITYAVDAAERDFNSFVAGRPVRRRLYEEILDWLLNGSFPDDGTLGRLRRACEHLSTGTASATTTTGSPVGVLATPDWLHGAASTALLTEERQTDLADHVQFLAQAVRTRSHYLLVGAAGVGKSLFIRHLLRRAVNDWSAGANPDLRTVHFLFLDEAEFIGSDADVESRLQTLYRQLVAHPTIVPVFDGFERFLNDNLGLGRLFISQLGGMIGGPRTFALVCRTSAASTAPLLRAVRPSPLAALSPDACQPILQRGLAQAIRLAGIKVEIESGSEVFCEQLATVVAERYPGQAFPEIGLRVIGAVVQRAVARVISDAASHATITTADVRRHVAREQGLSVEVLEKEPDAFYADVAQRLKTTEVIGQDHAVDRVCRVLAIKAKGKPRKLPRGRFLLVGPPGVGKTQLGRSLAKLLGYGVEGFFSYNMGDFAGEGDRWRFVGAPAGYEGFGQVRTIFDEVRDRPSCVILLDEIDRAHTSIQDILLAILEGEARDARNERVYFSQAIFLMTTNLGQEQVTRGFEDGRAAGLSREAIAARFNAILRSGAAAASAATADADEDMLRRLILDGIVDHAELAMIEHLDSELQRARVMLGGALESNPIVVSESYLGLRDLRERVRRSVHRSALDRAMLDRIDFILPFFPIKDGETLDSILGLKLNQAGWSNCPATIRAKILREALNERESVRPLERLIERSMSDAP